MRGVGLREIPHRGGRAVEIGTDSNEWTHAGGEAARARSDVEHALAGSKIFQDFVHGLFLRATHVRLALRWAQRSRTMVHPCMELRRGTTGRSLPAAGDRPPGSIDSQKLRGATRGMRQCAGLARPTRPLPDWHAASDTKAPVRRRCEPRLECLPVPARAIRAGSAIAALTAPAQRARSIPSPSKPAAIRDRIRAWSRE